MGAAGEGGRLCGTGARNWREGGLGDAFDGASAG